MANHKSAKKRAKQTIVKSEVNKARRTETKSLVKSLRNAISEKNKEETKKLLPSAQSLLAKLAKAGVIKKNTAARKISRLASKASNV